MDLIGDMRDAPYVLALDDEIMVCCKLVSDCVQARGRLLPRERGLLFQLHQFHWSPILGGRSRPSPGLAVATVAVPASPGWSAPGSRCARLESHTSAGALPLADHPSSIAGNHARANMVMVISVRR